MKRILFFVLFFSLLRAGEIFNPGKAEDLLGAVSDKDRPQLIEALKDAGGNWSELADAIKALSGEERDAAVWLIDRMPHLDRLEMTGSILREHVEYAFKAKTAFRYVIPETLFNDYILTYRISDEPVEAWRRPLFERFASMVKNDTLPADAARAVNRWISRHIKLRPPEFFGPLQSPLLTLKTGQGTDEEIAILTSAILKSLAIPSRRVSVEWLGEEDGGASWVEIYSNSNGIEVPRYKHPVFDQIIYFVQDWAPLYPLDAKNFANFKKYEVKHRHNITAAVTQTAFEQTTVTKNYTETGTIKLTFLENGKPKPGFNHFSVNVYNGGGYRALDDVGGDADSTGVYRYELGEGRYQVVVGVRDQTGNPFVTTREVVLKPHETLQLNLEVSLPLPAVPTSK